MAANSGAIIAENPYLQYFLGFSEYKDEVPFDHSLMTYFHKRFGFYPESVHADQIYRNQDNRRYCRKYGIRLSGPPLGRPKKLTAQNAEQLKQEKQQHRQDEIDRIAIEGKFGQGKRRFSLARIMSKLAGTSEVAIMISFMVMNLEKILSSGLYFLLHIWQNLLATLQGCCNYVQNLHWLQKISIRMP